VREARGDGVHAEAAERAARHGRQAERFERDADAELAVEVGADGKEVAVLVERERVLHRGGEGAEARALGIYGDEALLVLARVRREAAVRVVAGREESAVLRDADREEASGRDGHANKRRGRRMAPVGHVSLGRQKNIGRASDTAFLRGM